jgi:hypothetical protein
VQALEDEIRIIKQALLPKARFAVALARARARGVSPREVARIADRAVRGVRRSASRRSA